MSLNTYLHDAGVLTEQPIVAWLITGGAEPVLVDVGAPSQEYCAAHQRPVNRTARQELRSAIEAHGVSPDEIHTTILTHLHWDHAGGVAHLPGSLFVAQRREMQFAIAPIPTQARGYDAPEVSDGRIPFWLHGRYRTVDGDHEVLPGIRLMLTPGHTQGLQTVLVTTSLGTVALASDTVPLFRNWEERIVNGIHCDLEAYYQTFRRLESVADVVLPSHDPRIFDRACYG
jgi:N-acyl homoserine lactone hydrolase